MLELGFTFRYFDILTFASCFDVSVPFFAYMFSMPKVSSPFSSHSQKLMCWTCLARCFHRFLCLFQFRLIIYLVLELLLPSTSSRSWSQILMFLNFPINGRSPLSIVEWMYGWMKGWLDRWIVECLGPFVIEWSIPWPSSKLQNCYVEKNACHFTYITL